VNYCCGPGGRRENPAAPVKMRKRRAPYKPEVLTYSLKSTSSAEKILHENGRTFKGKLISVTAKNLPDDSNTGTRKLIVKGIFTEDDPEQLAVHSAILLGRYFIFRRADGICIKNSGRIQGDRIRELSFSILQSTGARITRVVYLSCPTCGRTKFNLQDAVKRVKAATGHLAGLKIAVMGCIVNGPGEMEGADYGFVGTSEGKVNIYRGIVPVLKNIPYESAAEKLIALIQSDQGKR
jgi:hypothetical protein